MYCSACGSPVTPGLKFCNRCGTSLGKNLDEKKEGRVAAGLIWAVVMVALFGLGVMFSGAIALRNGGGLTEGTVSLFMLFSFAIVGTVEVFLLRQLSRVIGSGGKVQHLDPPESSCGRGSTAPATTSVIHVIPSMPYVYFLSHAHRLKKLLSGLLMYLSSGPSNMSVR